MTSRVGVRMSDGELARLDRLVAAAGFASRAAALRAGLARLASLQDDAGLAAAYRRGYRRDPGVEDGWAVPSAAALAAALGPPAAPAPQPPRQVVTDAEGLMWDVTPRDGEPVPPEVVRRLRRPVGIDLAEVERRRRQRGEDG